MRTAEEIVEIVVCWNGRDGWDEKVVYVDGHVDERPCERSDSIEQPDFGVVDVAYCLGLDVYVDDVAVNRFDGITATWRKGV